MYVQENRRIPKAGASIVFVWMGYDLTRDTRRGFEPEALWTSSALLDRTVAGRLGRTFLVRMSRVR